MPAPGEDIELEPRRVGELHQEDLVGRNGADGAGRKGWRQRMETVENNADGGMIGAAHDLPGIAVVADMPAPGQRLIADAQAPRGSPLAKLAQVLRGAVDAAKRNG